MIYQCSYFESGSYGYYQEANCIVVADSEKEALQMCMKDFNTCIQSHLWDVIPLNYTERGIYHRSYHEY